MDKIKNLSWAVASVIKKARERSELTQGQLAGFSGLSDSYIALVEQGNSGISLNALMQISLVLNIKASDLLRQIEGELDTGPVPPRKGAGRPRKIASTRAMQY